MELLFIFAFAFPIQVFAEGVYEQPQLDGSWTYRSFHSNPHLSTSVNNLIDGLWKLEITNSTARTFDGKLSYGETVIPVNGKIHEEEPLTITFESQRDRNKSLVINGRGYLNPMWKGVGNQRPSLVGTVKVTSDAKRTYVCQWIAIKQNRQINETLTLARLAHPSTDIRGDRVFASGNEDQNKLVVFSKGFSCAHCSDQISTLLRNESKFIENSTQVLVIVAEDAESLRKSTVNLESSIRFVADPDLVTFKKVGCNKTNYSHGIFLFEPKEGICAWSDRGTQPYVDLTAVFKRINSIDSIESEPKNENTNPKR